MLRLKWNSLRRKKKPEFGKAFSEFSKSLTLIIDLQQLKDNVISRLRETIDVESVIIFLFNADVNRFEVAEARGYTAGNAIKLCFIPDDPLISWLRVNETHLSISDKPAVFSFFNDHEKSILRDTGTEIIFPLLVMNKVTGVVLLSTKKDASGFSDPEIDLLHTLLGQAAFAFENASLYQQQKSRLRKMYRADRLATIGQLAAGAAHEIRNPLTSIRSTIQYLAKDSQDENKRMLLGELIGEVDRINEIIEGLLSFSKPSTPEVENVDVEALLEQTLHLVNTSVKKMGIKVVFTFDAAEKYLQADPSQLKQVFLNIIMNSLQAMEKNGRLTITVKMKTTERTMSKPKTTFYFSFEDTGPGISPENLDHIFDPFFTTKKEGTGLGLSISYGIIQQHHGDFEIESTVIEDDPENHGTKVTISLPSTQ